MSAGGQYNGSRLDPICVYVHWSVAAVDDEI